MIRAIADVRSRCEGARVAGRRVGFVPTMGALHDGHASLIERARRENDLVVVSIFVNPLQFGEASDLERYPRDEEHDVSKAERLGADILFAPTEAEMYPDGRPLVTVDPGPLGERLEGASRPGHFRGVATVVAKLFDVVGASRTYVGEKDAQQVAVIRRMVEDLDMPIDLVVCPIVRDPDGLALSSRNRLLTPGQREAAGCLFLALAAAAELAKQGERDAAKLIAVMAREIGATGEARLDYAAVVDDATFEEVRDVDRPARAIVAARFGGVRLIDTLLLPPA